MLDDDDGAESAGPVGDDAKEVLEGVEEGLGRFDGDGDHDDGCDDGVDGAGDVRCRFG